VLAAIGSLVPAAFGVDECATGELQPEGPKLRIEDVGQLAEVVRREGRIV
jgi:hypothetical protein